MSRLFLTIAVLLTAVPVFAQVESAGSVRKNSKSEKTAASGNQALSGRMQGFFEEKETHDADLTYMREIYRKLDLTKPENAVLSYPEDITDGHENLFRIIFRLVTDGSVPAYEYLDGKEVFSDRYLVKVPEMLERFGIYAQTEKGSSSRTNKIVIDEADVPSSQVLSYYIIEKWEFDRRSNRMKTRVEAICPVLTRTGDYGDEARYPMFWVKFDALRPYLAREYVFLSDDNNLPTHTLDDYFNLALYDGEIYKTRNHRNLSMAQMFPDEDDRKRAQDSIDNRLRSYGKNLWVPTREEYLSMKENEAKTGTKGDADSIPERTVVTAGDDKPQASSRAKKNNVRKKTSKKSKVKSATASQNASRSVRRRRR